MNSDANRREAARRSGEDYGTRAAELCLVLLSTAAGEEAVQEHIRDLARNIRGQALRHASNDLGEELVLVWKEAALKAAQARLNAANPPDEPG